MLLLLALTALSDLNLKPIWSVDLGVMGFSRKPFLASSEDGMLLLTERKGDKLYILDDEGNILFHYSGKPLVATGGLQFLPWDGVFAIQDVGARRIFRLSRDGVFEDQTMDFPAGVTSLHFPEKERAVFLRRAEVGDRQTCSMYQFHLTTGEERLIQSVQRSDAHHDVDPFGEVCCPQFQVVYHPGGFLTFDEEAGFLAYYDHRGRQAALQLAQPFPRYVEILADGNGLFWFFQKGQEGRAWSFRVYNIALKVVAEGLLPQIPRLITSHALYFVDRTPFTSRLEKWHYGMDKE